MRESISKVIIHSFVLSLGLTACGLTQQQWAGTPAQPAQPAPAGTQGPATGQPAPAGQPEAPAGPKRASFTLRNKCSQTVKLFFGDKPKFGSGKSTTIGGNSQQNENMSAGDMIWIVDASDNGVTSHTISGSEREVAIGSSCTGFEVQ